MATQEKQEVLMLELFDKRKSNVFLTGTDQNPVFLDAPERAWIPNSGFRVTDDGKMQKIRYLENDTSIIVDDQDARKVEVDKKKNKIEFEKSYLYITLDPTTATLAEYLTTNLHCKSAPNRPANSGATILYDIVKLDEKAERQHEGEEIVVEALHLLYKLRKKEEGRYVYNEEKIEAYTKILSLYGGESPAEKFSALNTLAKTRPEEFVSLITTLDSTVRTEVAQALQMKVISFSDDVASFADGDKVIKPLPSDAKTAAQKIEFVSDFLKTSEGNEFLTEMRARVDAEKQKKLANK